MKEIYLDNAATTKVKKEVVLEMEKYFTGKFGNPSSLHEKGDETSDAINKVRKNIAKELGAKIHEIVFTSGGTESNNLAIQGIFRTKHKKKKIVISSIEHSSVMQICKFLERKGFEVVKIPVDKKGFTDLEVLEKSVDKNTLLVSVMAVNNIFGTIQNLKAIGKICKKKRVYFHTDAVQGFGKFKINVKDLGIDLLSASSHKIGGPKGIGFLYVKSGTKIQPLFFGGGQEKGLRSGTENVPGIIGFGKALEIYKKKNWEKIEKLRNLLFYGLEKIGGVINGSKEKRVLNNVNVSFSGANAENLIYRLSEKKIYVSSGSACDSKKKEDDLILKSLGLNGKEILGSLRLTLDEENSEKDIKKVVKEISKLLN